MKHQVIGLRSQQQLAKVNKTGCIAVNIESMSRINQKKNS